MMGNKKNLTMLIQEIKHEFGEFHHEWCNNYKEKRFKKINKLFEQSERERLKELMLAQLLGFRLASSGFGIKELVSSAGLTFDEWNEIKDETDVTSLKDSELDEMAMNRERMLGIFQNLLMEMQEAKIIDTDGNNKIMRVLVNNTNRVE